jgi:hypothetical protein
VLLVHQAFDPTLDVDVVTLVSHSSTMARGPVRDNRADQGGWAGHG